MSLRKMLAAILAVIGMTLAAGCSSSNDAAGQMTSPTTTPSSPEEDTTTPEPSATSEESTPEPEDAPGTPEEVTPTEAEEPSDITPETPQETTPEGPRMPTLDDLYGEPESPISPYVFKEGERKFPLPNEQGVNIVTVQEVFNGNTDTYHIGVIIWVPAETYYALDVPYTRVISYGEAVEYLSESQLAQLTCEPAPRPERATTAIFWIRPHEIWESEGAFDDTGEYLVSWTRPDEPTYEAYPDSFNSIDPDTCELREGVTDDPEAVVWALHRAYIYTAW